MSRIEQLVRPALRRSGSGRIAFPLLGVAVACVAFMAHAQVGNPATGTPVASNPARTFETHTQRIVRRDSDDMRGGTAYAIVRKDNDSLTMSGSSRDARAIEAMRRAMPGDFLWVRKDDKDWVIDDPATIDRAERAWAGMEPLNKQMGSLNEQMGVHNEKMGALNTQMGRLSTLHADHPRMDAAQERMEELGRQQEALAGKQETLGEAMARADDAQQEQLSRQMEALSAQQEALSRQMEAQSRVVEAESARMQQNAQPMEALGRQMEEAGKPMEALGRQMDAIGQQMDSVSKQAERETLQLIDEAMAKGLAKPAPTRR